MRGADKRECHLCATMSSLQIKPTTVNQTVDVQRERRQMKTISDSQKARQVIDSMKALVRILCLIIKQKCKQIFRKTKVYLMIVN
jgi:hypothetical protein